MGEPAHGPRPVARGGEIYSLRMTLSGLLAPLTSPKVLALLCPADGEESVDRAPDHGAGVHVQTYARTLDHHWGIPARRRR